MFFWISAVVLSGAGSTSSTTWSRATIWGIDKHKLLLERGIVEELGEDRLAERAPELVVSDRFQFGKFSKSPHFAIAQSLFTHLTEGDIRRCLRRLRRSACRGCRLFATFFEADEPVENPRRSDSREVFRYTRDQMREFGQDGWTATYIGEWGHPRGQRMMLYVNGP